MPVLRVVGIPAEDEAELLEYFREEFEKGHHLPIEKGHSTELDNLIVRLNHQLGEFLSRYGIKNILVPQDGVHIVDHDKLPSEEKEVIKNKFPFSTAFYDSAHQRIMMLTDYKRDNKMRFTNALVHEMLHVNSFVSLEKLPTGHPSSIVNLRHGKEEEIEELSLGPRRLGLSVKKHGKKGAYFKYLDEAVIETLTKKFVTEYGDKILEISDERHKLKLAWEQAVNSVTDKGRWEKIKDDISYIDTSAPNSFQRYAYVSEREALDELVNSLYQENKESFTSPEDVFDLFVKAAFEGKLLPLARLIEKTYGKGSFREIGAISAKEKY